MMRRGYQYTYGPYPYPPQPGYHYDHHHHIILDNNNNIFERNPYPFDGPYFDRRLVEPCLYGAHRVGYDGYGRLRPYPYYETSASTPPGFTYHGRVDPYTSYRACYEAPLLAFPQPPPRPQIHPFYFPDMINCSIM